MIGYFAPEGYEDTLAGELDRIIFRSGRLFLAEGPEQKVHWVQNIWRNPKTFFFRSISEAVNILRSLGALWAYYPTSSIRRGQLISSRLPFFSPKRIPFLSSIPSIPLGSWTLVDDHTLLASSQCSSPFFHGQMQFIETKTPPSRAYLKLWEFFTRLGRMPKRGDRCLEIGASPGSWTWVLQQLETEILAVDRAPLDPLICRYPQITFMKRDAFSLRPEDCPDIDWVFSDVVCYPEKLLEWILPWIDTKASLVCTLKFQKKNDLAILKKFEAVEGGNIIRLFHHKHELTWYMLRAEHEFSSDSVHAATRSQR